MAGDGLVDINEALDMHVHVAAQAGESRTWVKTVFWGTGRSEARVMKDKGTCLLLGHHSTLCGVCQVREAREDPSRTYSRPFAPSIPHPIIPLSGHSRRLNASPLADPHEISMPPDTKHHICIQKSSIQPTLLLGAEAMAMVWKMLDRVGRSGKSR